MIGGRARQSEAAVSFFHLQMIFSSKFSNAGILDEAQYVLLASLKTGYRKIRYDHRRQINLY